MAGEVAEAAAEGNATDPRGGDDPAGEGKAEGVGGMIDVAQCAAGFHPGCLCLRVDVNAFHLREVDHEAVVAATETCAVVAAAADRGQETGFAGETERLDDIRDVCAAGDQGGMFVDHAVVLLTGGVVAGVTLLDKLPAQAACEIFDRSCCHIDRVDGNGWWSNLRSNRRNRVPGRGPPPIPRRERVGRREADRTSSLV